MRASKRKNDSTAENVHVWHSSMDGSLEGNWLLPNQHDDHVTLSQNMDGNRELANSNCLEMGSQHLDANSRLHILAIQRARKEEDLQDTPGIFCSQVS